MRLWHYGIVKNLPELQLKSQWRELVLMAKDIHEKGKTNHLLINKVMDYHLDHFNSYCQIVMSAMIDRGIRVTSASWEKLSEYIGFVPNGRLLVCYDDIFKGWHNKEYLRVCICNLYEKYHFGVGKSKITQVEWDRILKAYKQITVEDWIL